VVKESILFWHDRKWTAHALTVMPDHVHILATPLEASAGRWHSISTILHSIKSVSALQVNRVRGRRGPYGSLESFDRIVRDEKEFHEKANYILSNAVRANLVEDGWRYDGFWCSGMEVWRREYGDRQ
jgi:REP element-mobilizing transposase RayT